MFRGVLVQGAYGTGPEGRLGIWVPTACRTSVCPQCGRCCSVLDYPRDCTEEDVAQLARSAAVPTFRSGWGGSPTVPTRIWVRPGTDPACRDTAPGYTTLEGRSSRLFHPRLQAGNLSPVSRLPQTRCHDRLPHGPAPEGGRGMQRRGLISGCVASPARMPILESISQGKRQTGRPEWL